MKHIHIIGIGGTFMGGVAAIAKEAGFKVSGCDAKMYPPMSTQLEALGIDVHEGFDAAQLDKFKADIYVIGNVAKRGMDVIEAILNKGLPYTSGPQWLAENVLHRHWVLGVAGTHGKTTTASMARMGLGICRTRAGLPHRRRTGKLQRFRPSAANATPRSEQQIAVFRHRSRRIRHRLFRQTLQIRTLPSAYRHFEQSGIRPRRHFCRFGRHSNPIPSFGTHRAV